MQSHYFGCRINAAMPDVWTRFEIDAPMANAAGGEAGIFDVKGSGPVRRVAKIYNPAAKATLDPHAFKALAFLTSKYTEFSQAMPFVAWPLEVLFTQERPLAIKHLDALAGITMKRIDGVIQLEKLTTNGTGRVGLGNEAAVRIAATIAGQLKKLHQHNIIFCDFNPRNVLIATNKASVAFVDADAFQHDFASKVFTKPHYTPGYASIDHLNNKPGARTPADDNFVLAIHIFQLLTDGGHPFKTGPKFEPPGGAPLFGEVSPDDNILARRWPYSNVAVFHPPGQTPQHYARLHPELKAMFVRAFQNFQPPTAEEWETVLPRFRDSVEDPATRVKAPNPAAINGAPPPQATHLSPRPQPAQRPQPATVLVPPLPPPKRGIGPALLRTVGTALVFIGVLFHTSSRGQDAVRTLIRGMLGNLLQRLSQAFSAALRVGLAPGALALVVALVIHRNGEPAQHLAVATTAPEAHSAAPRVAPQPTPVAVTLPQSDQRREQLPWATNVTPSAAAAKEVLPWQVRKPVNEPSSITAAPRFTYRTPLSWGRRPGDDEPGTTDRPRGSSAGWTGSGGHYRYRDSDGDTIFRITPTR